jgi:hypothetical protein
MDIILPDERLLAVQKQLQNQYADLHYLQLHLMIKAIQLI